MTKDQTQITEADRESIALLLQEMSNALVESGRETLTEYESDLVSMGCTAGMLYERGRAEVLVRVLDKIEHSNLCDHRIKNMITWAFKEWMG